MSPSSADDDVPLPDRPSADQAVPHVRVGGDEPLDDLAGRRPHQQGAVVRVGQRAGEQQLTAPMSGVGEREVLLAQRRTPLQVVPDERVLQDQVPGSGQDDRAPAVATSSIGALSPALLPTNVAGTGLESDRCAGVRYGSCATAVGSAAPHSFSTSLSSASR
jgi:hypothetical protein